MEVATTLVFQGARAIGKLDFVFLGCRNGAIFPSEISARDKMTERGKSGREGKGMTMSNQSICLFCTNL